MYEPFEFRRVGGLEAELFASHRVVKAELEGVERQSVQGVHLLQTIAAIAHHGVTEVLHVYTNLVLAACLEHQFYERVTVASLDGAVVGHRLLTTVIYG